MIFGGRDLTVRFGDHQALDGVSLDVPAGEVTALVGGDGAGKSTLLRCLVGQVRPTAGTVDRPPKTEVGYMPAAAGTWRDLTVDENVRFVGRCYGMAAADVTDRSGELLGRAGIGDVGGRLVGNLSGGMRQKLGFVLAILHRPALLVLDEPSTGVDPVSRVELWRLIAEAAADGVAVAMATTYLDEAERATSLLVLDRGRALLAGPADEVVQRCPGRIVIRESVSDPSRAWRRGRAIHEWIPDAELAGDPVGGEMIEHPDLEDVTIACMLAARDVGSGHD